MELHHQRRLNSRRQQRADGVGRRYDLRAFGGNTARINAYRPADHGGHGPDEEGKKQAREDLLWVIINTKEFLFNH